MRAIYSAAALALVSVVATPALSAPIGSGQTNVEVTAPLAALGITPSVSGGVIVSGSPLVVGFEITGGDLDFMTLAGEIEHENASLELTGDLGTASTADDVTVILEDFVVDTVNSQLRGDVVGVGDDIALFDFDLTGLSAAQITDLDNPAIPLIFTDAAGDLLETTFGLAANALDGVEFGLAATAPAPVNEPGLVGLFGMSLIGLGFIRRRKG